MGQIVIRILDREFKLSVADEEEARLLEAARMVDNRMRSIRDAGRMSGLERIAIMAALQFAHDALSGDNSTVGPKAAELAGRMRKMTEQIDAEVKRQESLF
jgi:cell division protein ZapA